MYPLFDMFQGMCAILLVWAVLALALVGVGRLVWILPGPRGSSPNRVPDELLTAFWLGFCAVLGFLQLWNFWLPVDGGAAVVILAVGGLGLLLAGPATWRAVAGAVGRRPRVCLVLLLIALWLSNRAMGSASRDGCFIKNAGATEWIAMRPLRPGVVGDFAVPLADGGASALWQAMLRSCASAARGRHLGNGLLVLILFARVIPSISRLLNPRTERRAEHLFGTVLLVPAFMLGLSDELACPSPDVAPGVLTLVMFRTALAFCFDSGLEDDRRRSRWVALLGMCTAGVLILKPQAAVIAGALWLTVAALWLIADRPPTIAAARAIGGTVLALLLLGGPWAARNGMATGYPLFPSKVAAMRVDWRLPASTVDAVRLAAADRARAEAPLRLCDALRQTRMRPWVRFIQPPFDDVAGVRGFNWVRSWLLALPLTGPIEVCLPLLLAVIAEVAITRTARRSGRQARPPWAWLTIAPLMSLACWFWSGPDPRSGWPALWCLAGLMITWAYVKSSALWSRRAVRWAVVAAVFLLLPTFAARWAMLSLEPHGQPPLHVIPVNRINLPPADSISLPRD